MLKKFLLAAGFLFGAALIPHAAKADCPYATIGGPAPTGQACVVLLSGTISVGSLVFPYGSGSNQTATSGSFIGFAGFDGTNVQPLSVLSNGHLNTHVDNSQPTQLLGADGTHQLTVNSDGSLNAKITSPAPAPTTAAGALQSSDCDLTTPANCQKVLSTGEAATIGTLVSTQLVVSAFSTASNVREITGTASKNIYILSIIVSNTTATGSQFTISQGTGTNCGSNNIVLMVAQVTALANGGATLTFGNGQGVVIHTTVQQSDLCYSVSSASSTVYVTINYILAP